MPTETETIRYLFESDGLDTLQTGMVRTAKTADRAADAVDRVSDELRDYRREARRGADAGRRLSESVRGLEGAGRIFGGVFGEVTGIVGDLEAVAEGSAGAMGPAGLAGALGVLGALSVPVVLAKGAQAAVGLARGALEARDALDELGAARLLDSATLQGLDALEMQVGRLDENLYRIAAETGPALVPVLTAIANLAENIANAASSPLLDQLSKLDPERFGAAAGGLVGGALGALAGPIGIQAGIDFGSQIGGSLASGSGGGPTAPRRTLLDFVSDVKRMGDSARTATRAHIAAADAVADVALQGPAVSLALDDIALSAVQFDDTLNRLIASTEDAGRTMRDLREGVGSAVGSQVGQFGGGRQGGRAAATATVGGLLGEVPVIGGFLEETIGILVDIRGFLGGFVRGLFDLPVQIISGLAESIAEIPALIVDQIPGLISGLIAGMVDLLLSPFALIENLVDAVFELPAALAESLAGLPVRLLEGLTEGDGKFWRTVGTVAGGTLGFALGGPVGAAAGAAAGNAAVRGMEALGNVGGGGPMPPPAQMRQQAPQVYIGYGPSTLDELDAAQKFRSGFAGGRP